MIPSHKLNFFRLSARIAVCATCTVALDDNRIRVFHMGSQAYQACASAGAIDFSWETNAPLLAITCPSTPPTTSCGVVTGGQANSKPGHNRPFIRPPSPSPASHGPTN